jgi:hypothetical protein
VIRSLRVIWRLLRVAGSVIWTVPPAVSVGPRTATRGRQHLLLPREHDRDGTLIVMDLAQELAPWATATGTVIAAVGLLLAARQLKIQNRQQRLQLGSLYMNRFWAVDDELTMTDRLNEPTGGVPPQGPHLPADRWLLAVGGEQVGQLDRGDAATAEAGDDPRQCQCGQRLAPSSRHRPSRRL